MKTTSTGRPLQNIKSWIFLPSLIRSFLSSFSFLSSTQSWRPSLIRSFSSSFSFLSSTQSNYRSNCLKGGQEEHFVKCLPNNLKTKPDKGWFSPPSQTCRPCPGNKRGWNSVCNNNVNQMIIFGTLESIGQLKESKNLISLVRHSINTLQAGISQKKKIRAYRKVLMAV